MHNSIENNKIDAEKKVHCKWNDKLHNGPIFRKSFCWCLLEMIKTKDFQHKKNRKKYSTPKIGFFSFNGTFHIYLFQSGSLIVLSYKITDINFESLFKQYVIEIKPFVEN